MRTAGPSAPSPLAEPEASEAPEVPEAIVVLGVRPAGPGRPGPAMRRRVAHGVALWHDTPGALLLLSGGLAGPPPAEAMMMRDLAVAAGVPERRLIIEDRSRNTFENALYTGTLLRSRRWRRIVIITDAFHLPRARMVFRRLGFDVRGEAVPRPSAMSRRQWWAAWVREVFAYLRSAWLFRTGAHKALVAREWGD